MTRKPKEGEIRVVEECYCCNAPDVKATYTIDGSPKQGAWLCDVCRGTLVGNAYFWPDSYRNNKVVMRTIATCTNMILKEIRGQKQ